MLPHKDGIVFLAGLFLTLAAGVAESSSESSTRSINLSHPTKQGEKPSVVVHEGVVDDWVVKSNFKDGIFENGWAYLELETNASHTDQDQAYSAGFIEGTLTYQLIYDHWRNTVEGYCDREGEDYCDSLRAFLSENREYMDEMIEQHSDQEEWYQVDLVLNQLQGLTDGYRSVAEVNLTDEDILWMNLFGDLEDLEQALKPGSTPAAVKGDGHCSALIKLLPGNSDLLTAHVSWNELYSMLRIQKSYTFPYKHFKGSDDVVPGYKMRFSSYPGYIHSIDDYYLLSSGLLTLETTIGNSNPDLWQFVTYDTIMEWIRVLISNRLAVDGPSWADRFSNYNSGTYNNQWMIVNYNHFTPNEQKIRPGTLTVLEQIPGTIEASDVSYVLQNQTYWPSYNTPFYRSIFVKAGNQDLVDEYGDWFSYDKNPRALIFARDQGNVVDMDSMVKLMRYNDFQNDPLSACDCDPPYSAENAISCRDDLNPPNGTYEFGALGFRPHVGTDLKVVSLEIFQNFEFKAVSAPTYDQQPVFQWSTSLFVNNTPHYGHPDYWNFTLEQFDWKF